MSTRLFKSFKPAKPTWATAKERLMRIRAAQGRARELRLAHFAKKVRDDAHLDDLMLEAPEDRRAVVRAHIRSLTTFANEPEPYYADRNDQPPDQPAVDAAADA
jgi:hypothetical protein